LYTVFLMLPIYWLVSMSVKHTNETLGAFTLWPRAFTLHNYRVIFTYPTWYGGFVHSRVFDVFTKVQSSARAPTAPSALSALFLAAHQPDGAAGGLRPAVLPALLGGGPVRYPHRGGARALPVQYPARGLDPRGLHVGRAQGARRDRLRRWLRLLALLHQDIPAHHRRRNRGRRLLLLHVLLGRAAARQDAHFRLGQADRGHHDAYRQHLGLRARPAGGGRHAHHHPRGGG